MPASYRCVCASHYFYRWRSGWGGELVICLKRTTHHSEQPSPEVTTGSSFGRPPFILRASRFHRVLCGSSRRCSAMILNRTLCLMAVHLVTGREWLSRVRMRRPPASQPTHPRLLVSLASPLSRYRLRGEVCGASVARVLSGLAGQTVWQEMGDSPGVCRTLPNPCRYCLT